MTLETTAPRMTALAILGVLLALSLPGVASAQPTFSEGAGAGPATTDDIDLNITAGGTLTYGNARNIGLNLAGNLTIHEGMELFVAEASYVFGVAQTPATCADVRANPGLFPVDTATFCNMGAMMADASRAPGFNDWRENSSNFNWRLRFDHFFDADNAFFVANRGRMDYFAGLDLRLGIQVGYNRMLFREENHTLAMDVGVDATVDIYSAGVRDGNRALEAAGTFTPPNLAGTDARMVPALRLQFAYVNHINAVLTYDTTFEALWDIPNPDHFRFEWVNHIRSAIDTWLQISLDVTFRLDSLPPGQAASWQEQTASQTTTMFDMLTTLNLVGNIDLDGEPPTVEEAAEEAAACPEVTCPDCPVCADCAEAAPTEPPADPAPADAAPADAPAEAPPA